MSEETAVSVCLKGLQCQCVRRDCCVSVTEGTVVSVCLKGLQCQCV